MEQSSPSQELDELDRAILQELQVNARISNAELARRINLSQPAVFNRLRRLEARGFIRGYVALLDREMTGYDLLCFIHVRLHKHDPDHNAVFQAAVRAVPQILECHHVTGDYDYLLKAVAHNRKDLEDLVVNQLTLIPGIAHIQTSLVFTEVKATTVLPLI